LAAKFPLFGAVAEFASDPSRINYLQGRIPPATGLNRRFLLFFRVEQGNPVGVLEQKRKSVRVQE
jgi:hypothetical protein